MDSNIKAIIDLKGTCQSVIKWRLTDACNYKCSYCLRNSISKKQWDVSYIKEDNDLAIKVAPEIGRIINDMPGKVKLDLIGGEVSLLDLDIILNSIFKIVGNKLYRVNITTNMCKPTEFYTNLCNLVNDYGSELGITCSWHSEFISFEDFFNKFTQIKSPTNQKGIRVECVSRLDNQEDIKKLISYCDEHNLTYFVERDLRVPEDEKVDLMIGSSNKKKDRYKVIFNSDEIKYFKTRNEVVTGEPLAYRNFIYSDGYYCSRDYDYVYIERDKHMGRIEGKENGCKNYQSIYDFKPLKEPKKCILPGCSLCGHISLSKDINDLEGE